MNKTYDLTVTAPEEFAEACAQVLFRTVKEKPDAVIGLSTGRTTGDIHRRFAALVKEDGIDVSRLTIFGLDEVTVSAATILAAASGCWSMSASMTSVFQKKTS